MLKYGYFSGIDMEIPKEEFITKYYKIGNKMRIEFADNNYEEYSYSDDIKLEFEDRFISQINYLYKNKENLLNKKREYLESDKKTDKSELLLKSLYVVSSFAIINAIIIISFPHIIVPASIITGILGSLTTGKFYLANNKKLNNKYDKRLEKLNDVDSYLAKFNLLFKKDNEVKEIASKKNIKELLKKDNKSLKTDFFTSSGFFDNYSSIDPSSTLEVLRKCKYELIGDDDHSKSIVDFKSYVKSKGNDNNGDDTPKS